MYTPVNLMNIIIVKHTHVLNTQITIYTCMSVRMMYVYVPTYNVCLSCITVRTHWRSWQRGLEDLEGIFAARQPSQTISQATTKLMLPL